MVRIWLNHWFSTAYHIINMIKEDEKEFYVIGSNEKPNSVIQCVCDEWYQEPVLSGLEYVEYCVNFCKEHRVDVFMPRRGMLEISKHISMFEDIGTKVMVDDYNIISVLNHKNEAYELFNREKIGLVPEYRIVTTLKEFHSAYVELSRNYNQICFKFVHDEGGRSFHLIDHNRKGFEDLFQSSAVRIALEDVINALKERETFEPIMVMPYLPDEEVSVDCLKTEQGIIMLPRVKGPTRIEQLIFDDTILQICKDFYDKVGLEHPCNIQFKYLDGKPYFLEVNTRMSGGIPMASLAAGVNIPNIAVNKMLGIRKDWVLVKEEKLVSFVEMPVVV